jgi:hypothetical protein
MLITFLISLQGNDGMLFKTLMSLKKQTVSDYEVIIFNDIDATMNDFETHNVFLKDIFEQNRNVALVNNSKFQGHSFN